MGYARRFTLQEGIKALDDPRLSLLRGALSRDGAVFAVYVDALLSPEAALGAADRLRRVRLKRLSQLVFHAGAH
ncbi:MAG: hypothetical protein ACUVUP_02895 [Thermaceae bacterium]